jgi:hypothetical protein
MQPDEQLFHQPAQRAIPYGSGHLTFQVKMRKQKSKFR